MLQEPVLSDLTQDDEVTCADLVYVLAMSFVEEGDVECATYLLGLLVRANSGDALVPLADILMDQAVPRRPREARRLYRRALQAGDSRAAWNLAMHYRLVGKRRWYMHWLNVAAAMGSEDADEALISLAQGRADWWRLEDLYDPPAAAFGFSGKVIAFPPPGGRERGDS